MAWLSLPSFLSKPSVLTTGLQTNATQTITIRSTNPFSQDTPLALLAASGLLVSRFAYTRFGRPLSEPSLNTALQQISA